MPYFKLFLFIGKIFHKFVINPSYGDIMADNKEKLFLYINDIENKTDVFNLKNELNKIIKIKDIWTVISYIYIIIPVTDKNKLTIDGKEPEHKFLEFKENKNLSILDFIFYWRNNEKNRIIDLYNLGNDFYKRRMDLILIFSHLLLTEKILIKNYNNINSLYKEIKI